VEKIKKEKNGEAGPTESFDEKGDRKEELHLQGTPWGKKEKTDGKKNVLQEKLKPKSPKQTMKEGSEAHQGKTGEDSADPGKKKGGNPKFSSRTWAKKILGQKKTKGGPVGLVKRVPAAKKTPRQKEAVEKLLHWQRKKKKSERGPGLGVQSWEI